MIFNTYSKIGTKITLKSDWVEYDTKELNKIKNNTPEGCEIDFKCSHTEKKYRYTYTYYIK